MFSQPASHSTHRHPAVRKDREGILITVLSRHYNYNKYEQRPSLAFLSSAHKARERDRGETELRQGAVICQKAETSVNIGLCLHTIPDNTMINSHIPTVKIRSAWEKHRDNTEVINTITTQNLPCKPCNLPPDTLTHSANMMG